MKKYKENGQKSMEDMQVQQQRNYMIFKKDFDKSMTIKHSSESITPSLENSEKFKGLNANQRQQVGQMMIPVQNFSSLQNNIYYQAH